MRTFIFLLIFSGALEVSAQSVGGSGGGDRPGAHLFLTANPGCPEGRVTLFQEPRRGGDGYQTVARRCTNGRYYPYQPQPTPRRCVEGRIGREARTDGVTDRQRDIAVICRNGRYRPLEEELRAQDDHEKARCEEGATRRQASFDARQQRVIEYVQTCVKGRYVVR